MVANTASTLAMVSQASGQVGKFVNVLEEILSKRGLEPPTEDELNTISGSLEEWAASIQKLTEEEIKELKDAIKKAKLSILKDPDLTPDIKIHIIQKLDQYMIQPNAWLKFIGAGFNFPIILNTILMICFLLYLMVA